MAESLKYRARMNMNDPRLQTELRNASKGNAAIQGASGKVRGLYSSFGAQEGQRLGQAELAGQRMKNMQEYYDAANKIQQGHLNLEKQATKFNTYSTMQDLKMRKDQMKDAKLGSWIGLGLSGLGTAGNLYSGYQDRKAREQQTAQQDAMKDMWVRDNWAYADELSRRYPGTFGLSELVEKYRSSQGNFHRRDRLH